MFFDPTIVVAVVIGAFSAFGCTLAYVQWITGPGAPRTEATRSKVRAPALVRKLPGVGEHSHA